MAAEQLLQQLVEQLLQQLLRLLQLEEEDPEDQEEEDFFPTNANIRPEEEEPEETKKTRSRTMMNTRREGDKSPTPEGTP